MSGPSSLRGRWRRLALGLPTVLGLKPRGWFIPHRYAPLLPPPGAQPPYPVIERLFEKSTATFIGVLDAVDSHATQLEGLKNLFDQSWFPSLDAAVAYTLVRERKPADCEMKKLRHHAAFFTFTLICNQRVTVTVVPTETR